MRHQLYLLLAESERIPAELVIGTGGAGMPVSQIKVELVLALICWHLSRLDRKEGSAPEEFRHLM